MNPTLPRMRAVALEAKTFWLRAGDRCIALGDLQYLGRSPECAIVFDDPLVSRKHARLQIVPDGVLLADLGSANGVYVDGVRVRGERMLLGGERVRVGQQEVELCSGSPSDAPPKGPEAAITLDGATGISPATRPAPKEAAQPEDEDASDNTAPSHDVFGVMGMVIDKAFARHDLAEVQRLLTPVLSMIQDEASMAGIVSPEAGESASRYALKAAEESRKGAWIDKLIAIYAAARQPMTVETIDRVYAIVQRVDRIDAWALQAYVEILEKRTGSLGPTARFAIKRLGGLARVARSR